MSSQNVSTLALVLLFVSVHVLSRRNLLRQHTVAHSPLVTLASPDSPDQGYYVPRQPPDVDLPDAAKCSEADSIFLGKPDDYDAL